MCKCLIFWNILNPISWKQLYFFFIKVISEKHICKMITNLNAKLVFIWTCIKSGKIYYFFEKRSRLKAYLLDFQWYVDTQNALGLQKSLFFITYCNLNCFWPIHRISVRKIFFVIDGQYRIGLEHSNKHMTICTWWRFGRDFIIGVIKWSTSV
jgi:hypothetical protein